MKNLRCLFGRHTDQLLRTVVTSRGFNNRTVVAYYRCKRCNRLDKEERTR